MNYPYIFHNTNTGACYEHRYLYCA